jgi:DNA-directed RNA polymerase specialized sigma24 family protein
MKKSQFEDINLLRKLAWSFHKSTGIDWDELFSEACWLYLKARNTYDPKRGEFTKHAYMIVYSELINYLRDHKKDYEPLRYIDEIPGFNRGNPPSYQSFWESLSRDAQEMAEIILSAPKLFVHSPAKEAQARAVRTMIRRGWSNKRALIALRDLQLACLY